MSHNGQVETGRPQLTTVMINRVSTTYRVGEDVVWFEQGEVQASRLVEAPRSLNALPSSKEPTWRLAQLCNEELARGRLLMRPEPELFAQPCLSDHLRYYYAAWQRTLAYSASAKRTTRATRFAKYASTK